MKIFFFLNILPPYRVGLYNKINEKLNGNVTFFFDSYLEKNRQWNPFNKVIDFKYEVLHSPRIKLESETASNTKLTRTIYFPFQILMVCFLRKPDIIVTLEMGYRTLFCIIYAKVANKKVYLLSEVFETLENDISKTKRKLRKFICSKIDGAIAHGTLSFNYLIELGLEKEKIIISPDAIDNEFFNEESSKLSKIELRYKFNIRPECFVILFVGRFVHLKGIDLLINAIKELEKRNNKPEDFLVYLVGGTIGELGEIAKIIDNKIKVVNHKNEKSLIPYYVMADCMVFPTRQDVWGMVVNEAIACGLPVVVSKYAGCSVDLIENGVNGYLVDPLNEINFMEVLEKCIKDRGKLKDFSKRAKEKLKIYNHENAANKIVDFILKR